MNIKKTLESGSRVFLLAGTGSGFVAGILLLALSIFGLVAKKEVADEIDADGAYYPLYVSLIVMAMTLGGFLGAMFYRKVGLYIFEAVMLLVLTLLVAYGVMLLALSGKLEKFSFNSDNNITASLVLQVMDYQLAIYNDCCPEPKLGLFECVPGNPIRGCINDGGLFDAFEVHAGMCNAFEQLEVNGLPLVGLFNESACASPAFFLDSFDAYVATHLKTAETFFLSFGVLALVSMIAGCVVIGTKPDNRVGLEEGGDMRPSSHVSARSTRSGRVRDSNSTNNSVVLTAPVTNFF